MNLECDPRVVEVFAAYPESVQRSMFSLRELVLEAASEIEDLDELVETLKWGEPSYLAKHGSTVRMDWKEKNPDHVAIYFKCTSKLVPTFRELYPKTFQYEGNRAITFGLNEDIPALELKQCITMALTYHKRKHLPLLGF